LLWEQEVPSSNLGAPTDNRRIEKYGGFYVPEGGRFILFGELVFFKSFFD
jgi:hypothetical protein